MSRVAEQWASIFRRLSNIPASAALVGEPEMLPTKAKALSSRLWLQIDAIRQQGGWLLVVTVSFASFGASSRELARLQGRRDTGGLPAFRVDAETVSHHGGIKTICGSCTSEEPFLISRKADMQVVDHWQQFIGALSDRQNECAIAPRHAIRPVPARYASLTVRRALCASQGKRAPTVRIGRVARQIVLPSMALSRAWSAANLSAAAEKRPRPVGLPPSGRNGPRRTSARHHRERSRIRAHDSGRLARAGGPP